MGLGGGLWRCLPWWRSESSCLSVPSWPPFSVSIHVGEMKSNFLTELRPECERSLVLVREDMSTETPGVPMIQTSRDWTPIDNFNKTFVDSMVDRKEKGSSHDFIEENKVG